MMVVITLFIVYMHELKCRGVYSKALAGTEKSVAAASTVITNRNYCD